MLLQRAAERDVQHLHPTADRQERDVAIQRVAHDGEFDRVVLCDDAVELFGRRLLAVPTRVDVATAVQHDAVDPVEQRRQGGRQIGDRRQHERNPTGALYAEEVVPTGGERDATYSLGFVGEAPDDEDQRCGHGSQRIPAARRTNSL